MYMDTKNNQAIEKKQGKRLSIQLVENGCSL